MIPLRTNIYMFPYGQYYQMKKKIVYLPVKRPPHSMFSPGFVLGAMITIILLRWTREMKYEDE